MKTGGFTLLELLVVLAIVGILAAIAVPLTGAARARAQSAACLANLQGLGVALNAYLGDHNMVMPPLAAGRRSLDEEVPVIDNTLNAYAGDKKVFACPADRSLAAATGTSYYWNSALSGQSAVSLNLFGIVSDMSRIPVLVDKEGWHRHSADKVNHLFADGHVQNRLRLFSNP